MQNVTKLHKNQHGVKRMTRFLDCMRFQWENFFYSSPWQHVGKDSIPKGVIEASCKYSLFRYHEFCHAGALNDFNICHRSQLHTSLMDGTFVKMDFDFDTIEILSIMLYLDEIYSKLISC